MRIGESNNIKDIAPILANVFMQDFVLTESLLCEYQKYYHSKQEKLGLLYNYLNNQMSDYEIISIKKNDQLLTMVINDLNYCLMAEDIAREKNLEAEIQNVLFPCIFTFQGIKHYSISEVGENGELTEISDYSVISNPQILFDQLIYIDKDTIELGISLWKYIGKTGKNFLLLITANNFEVLETQIEQFNKLVNGNISNL